MALPIVATEVGGNARLLNHGRLGVLAPSGDIHAMAEALWVMAQDPAAATDRARQARVEAQTHHSLSAMLARYEGLFNQRG